MDNVDRDLLNLYMCIRGIPISIVFIVRPELDNPANELQYQLLKLDYRLQEFAQEVQCAINSIWDSIIPAIETLGNSLRELGDEMYDYEKEISICDGDKLKHYGHIGKPYYNYMIDARQASRRYLRNHVY